MVQDSRYSGNYFRLNLLIFLGFISLKDPVLVDRGKETFNEFIKLILLL